MAVQCPPDAPQKPRISVEEDIPFQSDETLHHEGDLEAEIELKARKQEHEHKVENYKNIVGVIILAVCSFVIVFFAIIDAHRSIESNLFSAAFDFAKTIATVVIGYLFASNSKAK